ADEPLDELDGKTPLEAANLPNMDSIASQGRCGTVCNIPNSLPCGSDVAIMSVMGYDPMEYYTGRAPLEAAAKKLHVDPDQWIFRCNLVTIIDGIMEDYSAGHIQNKEANKLIDTLSEQLGSDELAFYKGVSYRHLMTFRGNCKLKTTPPHDILGKKCSGYQPKGRNAKKLKDIMARAGEILSEHDVNNVRTDLGENPANAIWLWGQGKMPNLPAFKERFGLSAAVITGVDLVRGLAGLIEWDIIEVDGATGYLDTNYAGKGAAAVEALDSHDLVFVHVEAPDEAGHNANPHEKIKALQQIDTHIAGPVLDRLKNEGDDWRILILPDHPTPCALRTHTRTAVPFALAGKDTAGIVDAPFSEQTAREADLHIAKGSNLMEFFLKVR
ncbi:MAG: cofactor-independent phosphoglycerate mutase, partial [bacterium]|nr:cofactor-independent phosphoglycerate mutase [bacterium]